MRLQKWLIVIGVIWAVGAAALLASPSLILKYKADQGDAKAQEQMGIIRAQGNALGHSDYSEALHYFHLSAEQGNKGAQFYLGVIYSGARCFEPPFDDQPSYCDTDPVQGYMWYIISGETQQAQLMESQGKITKREVEVAVRRAAKWQADHASLPGVTAEKGV